MPTDLERFHACMDYESSDRRPHHELGAWAQTRQRQKGRGTIFPAAEPRMWKRISSSSGNRLTRWMKMVDRPIQLESNAQVTPIKLKVV